MQLLSSGEDIQNKLISLAKKHERIAFAVAWASEKTDFLETLVENRKKIEMGVIGTHFCQTHPSVLKKFANHKKVNFVLTEKTSSGVFHPKIYYFWSQDEWDLIIGSANLTHAAFTDNREVMLHISSNDFGIKDNFQNEVYETINQLYVEGYQINHDDIRDYSEKHKEAKKAIEKIPSSTNPTIRVPKVKSKILQMTWNEYFNTIKQDKMHSLSERCQRLSIANEAFKKSAFSDMDYELRRALAGYHQNYRGFEWGWFGSMHGALAFKNRISNNNQHFSNALNFIPLTGKVTKSDFEKYLVEFQKGYKPKDDKKLASYTRLLAMKRPDYFLCVNNANAKLLREVLGIKNVPISSYWDEIIEPILDTPWWKSKKPAGKLERDAWQGRVALLDAYCYE